MLSIKVLASILMLGHIGSTIYISGVLRKQYSLLRLPIHPALRRFRHVLFILSLLILLGNVLPIIIDGLTLVVNNTGRPSHVRLISILYALSNAVVQFVSAYLIHTLYRLAANDSDITNYSSHTLLDGDKTDSSDTIRGDK